MIDRSNGRIDFVADEDLRCRFEARPPGRLGREVDDPNPQVGCGVFRASFGDARRFQFPGTDAQPGGIGQFHRPALEGEADTHDVPRRPRDRRDDAALKAGEGVDERALADVRRPGDHDLPRHDEVATEGGEWPEGRGIAPQKRAVVLIEQNRRSPERRRLSQRLERPRIDAGSIEFERRGFDATRRNQLFDDPAHNTDAAVAVDFEFVRGLHREDHLVAGAFAEVPEPDAADFRFARQRPLRRAEESLNRVPGYWSTQRDGGDGPGTGRCEHGHEGVAGHGLASAARRIPSRTRSGRWVTGSGSAGMRSAASPPVMKMGRISP